MFSGRNTTDAYAQDDEGTPPQPWDHWHKALAYDTLLEMLMFSVFAVTLQSEAPTNSRPAVSRTVPDTPHAGIISWSGLFKWRQPVSSLKAWNELWLGENYVIF